MVSAALLLKPLVGILAVISALDSIPVVVRGTKFGMALMPLPWRDDRVSNDSLCDLCDDLVEELLEDVEILTAIPCRPICFGLPKCVEICENVIQFGLDSPNYPCAAAGYCKVDDDIMTMADEECTNGVLFSCKPKQYCRRKRQKFLKFQCELKPGYGRWYGIQNAAREKAIALAEGLMSQPHCGEKDAGPFCIAKPTGLGAIAEGVGYCISFVIGGYNSILAIESPGGDDDRQWLTFWLVLTLLSICERFFARVILSTIPLYYEAKLIVLLWLIHFHGAQKIYRKIRHALQEMRILQSDSESAMNSIQSIKSIVKGNVIIETELERVVAERKKEQDIARKTSHRDGQLAKQPSWVEICDVDDKDDLLNDAISELDHICQFLLSSKGRKTMEESSISKSQSDLLVEIAAEVISFHPQVLYINCFGIAPGTINELPPVDNGSADSYIRVYIQVKKSCHCPTVQKYYKKRTHVTSSTCYRTLQPVWNQKLEIILQSWLDANGFNRFDQCISNASLRVQVMDAQVGQWGSIYKFFRGSFFYISIVATISYIDGTSDHLSQPKKNVGLFVAIFTTISFVVSYIKAVYLRSDDIEIGHSDVPIDILMDQREHYLQLILETDEPAKITNSKGGLGEIRVSMNLSEH